MPSTLSRTSSRLDVHGKTPYLREGNLTRPTVILPILAGAISVLILLLRAPDAFTAPNFWAEDGRFFWLHMQRDGFFWSLVHPFAGYFHLLPRTIAGVVAVFDPLYAPLLYAVGNALVVLWVSVTIATCGLPPAVAFMFGASWLIVPHPNGEVFGNIANSQWILAPALILIFLTPKPTSRLSYANQIIFVIVTGFTGPFAALTAPLALWRLWKTQDVVAAISLIIACIAVTLAYFNFPAYFPTGEPRPFHLIKMVLTRTFPENWPTIVVSVAMLAIAVSVSLRRPMHVGFIFVAALILAAAAYKHRNWPEAFDTPYTSNEHYFSSRYFFIPKILLLWIAISLLFERGIQRYVGAVWIVFFATTYPQEFFWRQARPDTHWQEAVAAMKSGQPYKVTLSPYPWTMDMPIGVQERCPWREALKGGCL